MSKKPTTTKAEQTAPVAAPVLHLTVATAQNDITIPGYTKVLRPTDQTLIQKGGGKGIQLYREVLLDARAFATLHKRKRALVARDWEVRPASEEPIDVKAAEFVKRQLERIKFDRLTYDMLDATLMGFSAHEIVWQRDGFEIVTESINKLDQRRIVFGREGEPRLVTFQNLLEGEPFGERKTIIHRFENDPADPYGWGLGRILFWNTLFKREGVAFWLKALERFAVPLPIAKSPTANMPGEQAKIMDALTGAVANGAIVVPPGTEIEFAKAAIAGNLTHIEWCDYWDDQTAEVVLGENLTTSVKDAGSKAATQTHKEVSAELIDGDADLLTATLGDSLCKWLTEYNLPDAQPPNIYRIRPSNVLAEENARRIRADRRTTDINNLFLLRAGGFAPADLPEALSDIMGQAIVEVPPVPAPGAPAAPATPPSPSPPVQFAAADQHDHVGALTDALLNESADLRAGWFNKVDETLRQAFADGASMDDILARIDALDLPTDDLAALIDDAMTKASAQGAREIKALDRRK